MHALVDGLQKGAYVIKKCVLVNRLLPGYIIGTDSNGAFCEPNVKEEITMALSNIAGWAEENKTAAACGTACGASDKPTETPAACGAADKPAETPAACGAADKPAEAPAACGAADKPEEKPAACGTACGASDK